MRPRIPTILFVLSAAAGFFFAAWSTSDFVQHLDRQVHAIHCSFVPGLAAADASGANGCHVALMSPWSSVLRSELWGGVPISLGGLAVFAFLLFRGIELAANRRQDDRGAAAFLVAASLVPVLTSLFYAYVAVMELDAFCKLCAGIYLSSFAAFGSAVAIFATARPEPVAALPEPLLPSAGEEGEDEAPAALSPTATGPLFHLVGVAEGCGFVGVAALLYVGLMPDYERFVGACGALAQPDDPYGVMVPIGPQRGGTVAIEVFDPLCPACRGFEKRLESSGLTEQLDRKALLFPLDNRCNWMVGSAVHPGACTVSEAVLCAKEPEAVIAWAFEHQEAIRTEASADPDAALRRVKAAFPEVASCVGSASVRQKLNRSLRWAVANQLPVLTPQLYVGGQKLCDEDTDLGMDFSLSRLLLATKVER